MAIQLVDALVEKHGGHLDCRSTWGQGSEFAIAIPRKLSPQSLF